MFVWNDRNNGGDPDEASGLSAADAARLRETWPLGAPGVALPGPDFVRYAVQLGDKPPKVTGVRDAKRMVSWGEQLQAAYDAALYEDGFTLNVLCKTMFRQAACLPGHLWAPGGPNALAPVDYGPARARVMVVGQMPGQEELNRRRNFIGPPAQLLREALEAMGVRDYGDWYVTNLVRWGRIDPGIDAIPKAWVADCLPLLSVELRLVRPDYVLLLGAEAVAAVLGAGTSLSHTVGRVIDYPVDMRRSHDDPEDWHVVKLMTCTHPARVLSSPDVRQRFDDELSLFVDLYAGRSADAGPAPDYRMVESAGQLEALVDEILAGPDGREIAVDCEWHGDQPFEPGAYLRTVQFAWGERSAACVVLRRQGGVPAFTPDVGAALPALTRLLKSTPGRRVRVIGHFLRADIPWLLHYGVDLRPEFEAPADDPDPIAPGGRFGFEKTRDEGGFDTGLAAHAVFEAAGGQGYKLEVLASTLLRVPRYDVELQKWKKEYCRVNNLKDEELEGYGECPDDVLHPYALADPLMTLRLYRLFNGVAGVPLYRSVDPADVGKGLLDKDGYGLCSREAFWVSMRASPAFLEMEMAGVTLDVERAEQQTAVYSAAESRLLDKLRELVNWPGFNPASDQHRKELLFGEALNGKIDPKTRRPVRIRPEGARTLGLTPVKTTGKRGKDWQAVLAARQQDVYRPSCDKETLAILGASCAEAALLRDARYVRQVFQSVLRLPKTDKVGQVELDDDGNRVYPGGLLDARCSDGRVRTHFFQTKETGRASSARPPLQNLSCDGDTEILTPRGFVRLRDLRPGQPVAQYWPDTRAIDFVVPETQVQRYAGMMQRLTTPGYLDLLVTHNHRCLVRSREADAPMVVTAENLDRVDDHARVVHAGRYVGGRRTLDAWQVVWLCALQAVGTYDPAGRVFFRLKKARQASALRSCLRALGVDYVEGTARGAPTFRVAHDDPQARLARELMPDRRLGPWLLDCDRATLDLFAEEVCFWDGAWSRRNEYLADDAVNREWVQILWSLSGWRATLCQFPSRRPGARGHQSVCTLLPGMRRDFSSLKSLKREEVPWDDLVYCVTVPSSFIVVRRNGRVTVTGNSAKREADYRRILGYRDAEGKPQGSYTDLLEPMYGSPLRSMLVAAPGCVLVGADYTGAEIAVAAWLADDTVLAEHARRSTLDEDDPDYYDVHSSIAVATFRLTVPDARAAEKLGLRVGDPVPPSKAALKACGYAHLRVAAKRVLFGYFYGQGPDAAARGAKEESGKDVTVDECRALVDQLGRSYPMLVAFFDACRRRVTNPYRDPYYGGDDDGRAANYICNPFGRLRRFAPTADRAAAGDSERQAMNYPTQSTIADAVSRALDHIYHYRDGRDIEYRILLQLHDAVTIETPLRYAEACWHMLQECMVDRVPIYPCHLNGTPTGKGPYRLGISRDVCFRWSEDLTRAECLAAGLPEWMGKG